MGWDGLGWVGVGWDGILSNVLAALLILGSCPSAFVEWPC